jgi:diguanylate cyclase (GGDEF)-like protein/PAS domain S-box-containing protein
MAPSTSPFAPDPLGRPSLPVLPQALGQPSSGGSSGSTDYLLAERVLKESNDYIDSILACITDALIIITPRGEIHGVNRAACDLLGYHPDELTGQCIQLVLSGPVGTMAAELAHLEQPGGGRHQERSLLTKTGALIPVALSTLLRRDDHGQIQGIVFVARDLRERQQTVAALSQSEARNLALLRAIPDLIVRVSHAGIYLDVVPAEGFDAIAEHVVGKHLQEVWPPDLATQYQQGIEAAFATGEIQVFEYALDGRSGLNGRTAGWQYQEARIVACDPDEALMIVRDVTERRQSEKMNALLAAVVEHAVDGIEIADADCQIQYVNPAFEQLTGYTRAEVVGQPQAQLFDHAQPDESYQAAIAQGQIWRGDVIGQRRDGSLYPQETVISSVHNAGGTITNYVAVKRDVTERKQTELALKRYQLLSQHARDIVLFMQLDGRIVEANDAAVDVYGYSRPDLLKLRLHDLHEPTMAAEIDGQIAQASQHSLLYEAVQRCQDGRLLAVEVSMQGAIVGEETLLLSIIRDISTRKQAEAELFHNAFHDALTDLPNRALFLERLRHAVEKTQRQPYMFAVLFLDLDGFKVINDSLGHLAGDQLLVAIAHRLSRCLKSGDTLARFGGDEFTILLENLQDLSQAIKIAERIQQELSQPFALDRQDIFTTTSIGIVLSTGEMPQAEDLLRSADTALYRAKALGGTRYVVFDAEMHRHAMLRLHLETDLRRVLTAPHRRGTTLALPSPHPEFLVYYQPIVSLKTQKITSFEALLRWQHPERGLISPGELVPIAEETGLIVPIGWLVLRDACRQMRAWQVQFPACAHLTISVNLSVKQFAQPDLVGHIRQILHDTELSPHSLKLEITESVIMENADLAATMLKELQALGVQLSLDDFGTGYSSLAYLHRLPIDTLKIDRSFIDRLESDCEQLEIVRAIVTLAWNLGMDVVAEGIENNRQLSQLRALRCEYGQGYFFAKPQTSEGATAMLALMLAESSGQ